ncbi:MAG: DHH family phosphoesterase [Bacteroides sp.]|nr:MAG: DHH family phosphoesterase [Bacteroides sp.]
MKYNISNIIDLLNKTSNNIIIITHDNPDGDAIGSVLTMYNILLKKQFNSINIVLTSNYSNKFDWMPNINKVLILNHYNYIKICKKILKANIIFCLDFSNTTRIHKIEQVFLRSRGIKIVIDHHNDVNIKYDFLYHNNLSSSTTELLYDFIHKLNFEKLMDINIRNCLYTGILTDSNSFQFTPSKHKIFQIAYELVKSGVNNNYIYDKIYHFNNYSIIEFFGYCFYKKTHFIKNDNNFLICIISISKEEIIRYNIINDETKFIINYPLYINNVKLSLLLIEQSNIRTKISIRSKRNVDCNQIAKKYFNGGGHKNASGGYINMQLDDSFILCKKIFSDIRSCII